MLCMTINCPATDELRYLSEANRAIVKKQRWEGKSLHSRYWTFEKMAADYREEPSNGKRALPFPNTLKVPYEHTGFELGAL